MFDNLLGQDRAIQLLVRAVKQERIAPAYLFTGSSGIGKGLAAKSFVKLLLTFNLPPEKISLANKKLATNNHPDLLWVEPTYISKGELYTVLEAEAKGLTPKTPPKLRIEQIRRITQFLNRPVLEARRKVVVIEDVQTMAEAPANALLKTLEEPGNATIILIAPDADSLLTTLVSRCQQIKFCSLSAANLTTVLQNNNYAEIVEHPELIAIAQGSPGQAIAAWHQLQSIPDDLLQQLKQSITNPIEAMQLAQTITQELDSSTQLWLVDYLQYYYWHKTPQIKLMQQWEHSRRCLLSYVQPRLVWECALLNLQ